MASRDSRRERAGPRVGQRGVQVGDAPGGVAVRGPRLGPRVEQGGAHRRSGSSASPASASAAGLAGGVLGPAPGPRPARRPPRRRRRSPGVAVVAGDLGRVGALGLQRGGQQPVQPAALARRQAGGDGLPDQVVRRRPALLAEPQQAGPGQLGERVERRPRVQAGGRGHVRAVASRASSATSPSSCARAPVSRSARRRTARRCPSRPSSAASATAVRVARAPPAVRPGGRGAAGGQLAQHLGDRERGAVGRRAQHAERGAQRGVGGQPVDGRDAGSGPSGELGDRGGSRRSRPRAAGDRLVGAEGEHDGEPRQPGQRRARAARRWMGRPTAGRRRRARRPRPVAAPAPAAPPASTQRPRLSPSSVDVGAVELRAAARPARRGPAAAARRPPRRRAASASRQQRPGQPPRLGPLGQEGPGGEHRQRRRPRSPRRPAATCPPRRPRTARRRRGRPSAARSRGELGVAADEGQTSVRTRGPAGTGRGRHRRRPRRTAAAQRLPAAALRAGRRRRVDAQLVGQPARATRPAPRSAPARSPGRGQRPGQHQRRGLAQRVGRDRVGRRSRPPRRVVRAPARRGAASLQHVDPRPPQPLPRGAGPLGVGVLGQRLAPQRAAPRRSRAPHPARPARSARRAGPAQRRVELGDVHRAPRPARSPPVPVTIGLGSPTARRARLTSTFRLATGSAGSRSGHSASASTSCGTRSGRRTASTRSSVRTLRPPNAAGGTSSPSRRTWNRPSSCRCHVGHGAHRPRPLRRTARNPRPSVPTVVPTDSEEAR